MLEAQRIEFAPRGVDRVQGHLASIDLAVHEVQHVFAVCGKRALPDSARAVTAAAGHDVGHALHGLRALVVMVMAREHEIDAIALEQRNKCPADLRRASMIAGRIRRAVEVNHRPGQPIVREVAL